MGVHDYICFVQRNGQCLYNFTENGENCYGSNEAKIVLVPDTYSKRDILSWPLENFQKFESRNYKYSWDDWGFEKLEDYSDILTGDYKWYDQTIWKSSSINGYWLVNFHPEAYNAFVLKNIKPSKITRDYYERVYENRDLDCPKSKEIAYNKICNFFEENLYEYDRMMLQPLNIPKKFTSLLNKFEKHKLFTTKYKYNFETPQGSSFFKDRIRVLIQDNIKSNDPFLNVSFQSWSNYDSKNCEMNFLFEPNINIYIDLKLVDGCLKCGKKRWAGKYVCLSHLNENVDELKIKRARKIRIECKKLQDNMKLFENKVAPPNLFCSFNEKGIKYDILLNLSI